MANNGALPDELYMGILSRLSLEDLKKFMLVSKNWTSLIRERIFRNDYLLQSMTKPRMLLISEFFGGVMFHSFYQEEKPLLSSGHQRTLIISLDSDHEISEPIRGLICIREQTKVVICNLGAKKCMTLSEIQVPKGDSIADIRTYFGYDKDNDVFKVLCVIKMESEEANKYQYQIMTVRSSEESWRKIERTDNLDHTPITCQGLLKENVLYYGAKSKSNESIIVSFDMSSEKFTVSKLPKEVSIDYWGWGLVNYNEEIALVDDSVFDFGIKEYNGNGVFEMWVGNDSTSEWKIKSIVVHGWKEAVGDVKFFFKGTIRTGELVFAPNYFVSEPSFVVLYYDTVTHHFRKVEIEEEFRGFYFVRTIVDHVDTPQLM